MMGGVYETLHEYFFNKSHILNQSEWALGWSEESGLFNHILINAKWASVNIRISLNETVYDIEALDIFERFDHEIAVIFTNILDFFRRRGWALSLAVYFFIVLEELDEDFSEYFMRLDWTLFIVLANARKQSEMRVNTYGRRRGVLDSASWYSMCIISKMLERILWCSLLGRSSYRIIMLSVLTPFQVFYKMHGRCFLRVRMKSWAYWIERLIWRCLIFSRNSEN